MLAVWACKIVSDRWTEPTGSTGLGPDAHHSTRSIAKRSLIQFEKLVEESSMDTLQGRCVVTGIDHVMKFLYSAEDGPRNSVLPKTARHAARPSYQLPGRSGRHKYGYRAAGTAKFRRAPELAVL
ncbi:uncharacterized protein N7482_002209 [Penicillium canariense]|uniref:Uncharacterized protein n=1 Tax=Penicillium canariense TaxID=189055 RepID=A0A9W9IH50_9EURO|nr:uncharacterized protein N7482_002209 [Penicillium canariense]KAJ5176332.1 hypothetical protein N7482_002209 [Penicillium canariense]